MGDIEMRPLGQRRGGAREWVLDQGAEAAIQLPCWAYAFAIRLFDWRRMSHRCFPGFLFSERIVMRNLGKSVSQPSESEYPRSMSRFAWLICFGTRKGKRKAENLSCQLAIVKKCAQAFGKGGWRKEREGGSTSLFQGA